MRKNILIRESRKSQKAIMEAQKIDYDKYGNAIITVGIDSIKDFFDPYCHKTYKLLNSEMLEYIENVAYLIPSDNDFSLHIYTETSTSSKQKRQMKEAIKHEYAENFVSLQKQLRSDSFLSALSVP